MALKIKLKPMGRIDKRFYRVVIAEQKSKRDGHVMDTLGYFNPRDKVKIKLDEAKLKKWLSQGALPTPAVRKIINT